MKLLILLRDEKSEIVTDFDLAPLDPENLVAGKQQHASNEGQLVERLMHARPVYVYPYIKISTHICILLEA